MLYIIAFFVIVRLLIAVAEAINLRLPKIRSGKKWKYTQGLFTNNFIDSKVMFVTRFGALPNVSVITQIDITSAYEFITSRLGEQVRNVYQANMFDHNAGESFFQVTIIELTNKRLLELGPGYVEVLHNGAHFEWAKLLLLDLAAFKLETNVVEEKAPTIVGFARAMEMN